MRTVSLNKRKLLSTAETEINERVVSDAIAIHREKLLAGYIENEDMYLSQHEVLRQASKDAWKPDNRLVINYAKYIVDTLTAIISVFQLRLAMITSK